MGDSGKCVDCGLDLRSKAPVKEDLMSDSRANEKVEKPELGSKWRSREDRWDFSGKVQGVCNWDHPHDHKFPPLVVFLTPFKRYATVSALEVKDRLREVPKKDKVDKGSE